MLRNLFVTCNASIRANDFGSIRRNLLIFNDVSEICIQSLQSAIVIFTRTLSELLADKGNSSEWRCAWSDLDTTNICKLSGGEGVKIPIECDFGHKRDAGILI